MNIRYALLVPAALAGLLACGGRSSDTASTPAPARLDTTEAMTFTATFLDMENNQVGEAELPVVEQVGDALAMPAAAPPRCATVVPVSETSAKWVYENCTGPHGWTWNGTVLVSWQVNTDGTELVKHESQNMVGTRDGRSWTVNGVKRILRNKQTKQVQISTEKGFTKLFNDGTKSITFEYDCKLFADHSVEGRRSQWGDWSMTPLAPSTAPGASGNVDKKTPLVWERGTGCCHPISGTLDLKRGEKSATLVFGLPCGTVTINGETKALGPCR
jgi:hypothetical protein